MSHFNNIAYLIATFSIGLTLLSHPTSALVTPTIAPSSSSSSLSTRQVFSLSLSSSSSSSSDDDDDDDEDEKPAVMSSKQLFESPSWTPIKRDLDSVPIFCVANPKGQPIAYSVSVKNQEKEESFQVPFFYTNIQDALDELTKAKAANQEQANSEMDLIPFPLGVAFELWAKDQAVIVPNAQAIQQAGAPPGTNPIGQAVPLFACMEIMQEVPNEDGSSMVPVLPLFMVLEDCNEAVEQAVEMDGGNADEFEVVSLSLTRAVEQLAANAESTMKGSTPGFQFIPPKTSMDYIQKYLTDSAPPSKS